MSNVKGEQPLPLEIPEQPTERYRVWQVPGLRVWFVWDTVRDEAVDLPSGVKSDCDDVAGVLNALDQNNR